MHVEAQHRLVVVSPSRVHGVMTRWWSMEVLLADSLRGLSAWARRCVGEDFGQELGGLEALGAAIVARLPGRGAWPPKRRRARAPSRSLVDPEVTVMPQSLRRAVEGNRTVRAEVSNLADLFQEWEQTHLVEVVDLALEVHGAVDAHLVRLLEPAKPPEAPPVTALYPRFIPGVRRGPLTPWGKAP